MKALRRWWRAIRTPRPVSPPPRMSSHDVLAEAMRTLGGCGSWIATPDGGGVCFEQRGHVGPHRFVAALDDGPAS